MEMGDCFLDFWAFAPVEAVEVLLDTQKFVGIPSEASRHAGPKGDGPLPPGLFGPLRVLKQLKYLGIPKSLLAILVEHLSMQVSR